MLGFSSTQDDGWSMKRYVVTLEKAEREELSGITGKGSHRSRKVINALIPLNCDGSGFNEHRATGEAITGIPRVSMRTVDRVTGQETLRAGRAGGGAGWPAGSPAYLRARGRRRVRGAPGG